MGTMPELTITSPCVLLFSRVYFNTFTLGNPLPESTLTLCQSRLYPPSQGLWIWPLVKGPIFVFAKTRVWPRTCIITYSLKYLLHCLIHFAVPLNSGSENKLRFFCCILSFSFILFYSLLFYYILFYSILFYSILFYSILFYSILFYSILF